MLYEKYKEFLLIVGEVIGVYKKLQSKSNKYWREMSELLRELSSCAHIAHFPYQAFQLIYD
jgi:hypothetical protein